MDRRCLLSLVCAVSTALISCKRAPEGAAEVTPDATGQPATEGGSGPKSTSVKRPPAPPAPAEIWKEFSGDKAFAEVRKQIEIGPRPSGSAALEKARELIEEALKRSGWDVERQTFTDQTPRGEVQFTNLIARFSPGGTRPAATDTQRAIVCSHFDTKHFSTIEFVGANDGASSTGALLELARVLAMDPTLAAKIELAFFDGEEAVVQFTETDGLYGSRYYAKQLAATKRAPQFKFAILWDMIGDSDLKITLPPDSPPDLARDILASADALNLRSHFGYFERQLIDDHVSLKTYARITAIDLIDFEYPYWHTADDTIDRLSPDSLQKIGSVTLHHLRKALGQ